MRGHSRSIKSDPLGLIDTRVTMADPVPLLPSFASMTALDGPSQNQSPADSQESRKKHHKPSTRRETATDDALGKPQFGKLECFKRDRDRCLDGCDCWVPWNPQNTPASRSEQDERSQNCDTGNLHTGSAPDLPIDWLNGSHGYQMGDKDADEWRAKPEERRSSADEPTFVTLPTFALEPVQQAANTSPTKELQSPSPAKRVQFPLSTGSPLFSRVHRPLPSVERKQDYVSSHRQMKQHEKWGITKHSRVSPRRSPALANPEKCKTLKHSRGSPYRNPVKISQLANVNKRPNIHFSFLSNHPFCQPDPKPFADPINLGYDAAESIDSQKRNTTDADGPALSNRDDDPQGRVDFVAVSFSVQKVPCVSESSTPNQQAKTFQYKFQMQWKPIIRPQGVFLTQDQKQAVCRSNVDDLVLHVCVILPAWVLRIFFIAGRAVPSRIRGVTIRVARVLLSMMVYAFFYLLSKFRVDGAFRVEVNQQPKYQVFSE